MQVIPSKGEISTMIVANIRLSKLRRLHFVDVDDNDVGSLEDITFAIDNLIPQHLILGSNFFEELMEEIGKRENIDEIAPLSIVAEIDSNHAILSESIDDLERTTGTNDYLEKYQVILYSVFQKFNVHDINGVSEAELIDVQLNGSSSQFIFNYHKLKSKLMTDGYMQRFEIAVPINKIEIHEETLIISTDDEDIATKAKQQHQPKERGKSTVVI